MKKTPTYFARDLGGKPGAGVVDRVHPGCEWVADGEGVATRKVDGTCVLIRRDGMAVHAFARREVKTGKRAPEGFVLADKDPVTGKRFGWEPMDASSFKKAYLDAVTHMSTGDKDGQGDAVARLLPGTYELCGPKINGNPEGYSHHVLVRHATAQRVAVADRSFDGIRTALADLGRAGWEGIVFHHPDGRMAKIKVRDFPGLLA